MGCLWSSKQIDQDIYFTFNKALLVLDLSRYIMAKDGMLEGWIKVVGSFICIPQQGPMCCEYLNLSSLRVWKMEKQYLPLVQWLWVM